jgi:hypothetical protein
MERSRRSRAGSWSIVGAADEVLEGAWKTTSGGDIDRATGRVERRREDAEDQGESPKVKGGAGKPNQPATDDGPGSHPPEH